MRDLNVACNGDNIFAKIEIIYSAKCGYLRYNEKKYMNGDMPGRENDERQDYEDHDSTGRF